MVQDIKDWGRPNRCFSLTLFFIKMLTHSWIARVLCVCSIYMPAINLQKNHAQCPLPTRPPCSTKGTLAGPDIGFVFYRDSVCSFHTYFQSSKWINEKEEEGMWIMFLKSYFCNAVTFPTPTLNLKIWLQVLENSPNTHFGTKFKIKVLRKFCNTHNWSSGLSLCILQHQLSKKLV